MAISSYRLNADLNASATDADWNPAKMSHSRNFSYPAPGFPGGSASQPSGGPYSPSDDESATRYYPSQTSNVRVGHHSSSYYPPIAPASPSSDRYSSGYRSSGIASPDYSASYGSQYNVSDGRGYSSGQPSSDQYPLSVPPPAPRGNPGNAPPYYRHSATPQPQPQQRQFIPTPSEAYASPPRYPRPYSAKRPSGGPHTMDDPYSMLGHHGVPPPISSRSGSGSARPKTSMGTSSTTSSGERYVCEICGKDFSRAHDRKRHHETQHAAVPVTHKCMYCDKDFSRADSLKRHIQNGCDEAPQQH